MHVPEGWKQTHLSDIAFINPKKSSKPLDGLVSFVPMDAVSETARLERTETKKYEDVEKGFTSFIDGDVLVAKITPCFENGKGALVYNLKNGIGFGSTEFHVLRAKQNSSAEFIYYITTNDEFRIRGEMNMQGSAGQKRVSTDYLRVYKLNTPPLPEQQKIAQILSTWDKAIAKLEALIAAKQKRKKALMQQLLTGNKRFAGFEGEWKEIRLGDLGKCIRGVSYKPDQILNSEEEGSIRLLRSTNIQNGNLNDKELVIIPSSLVKKNQLLEHGDLVLCMANGSKALVGKSAPFRTNEKIYTVGAFCATFRPAKNSNKDFIKFLFESETYSRELKILLSGSSINNLKGSDVEAIKMFLPGDNKEQQKIASVLSAADTEIETHQNQLSALKEQKKGLMQQLLTGKNRVKLDS